MQYCSCVAFSLALLACKSCHFPATGLEGTLCPDTSFNEAPSTVGTDDACIIMASHGLGLSEILQPASDLLSMRATKAASSSGSAPLNRISCNGCPSRLCKEPLRCMTCVHGHTCAGEEASPSSSAAGPARKAPGNSASSTNACSTSSSKLHAMWRTNLHIFIVSTVHFCSIFWSLCIRNV